MIYAVLTDNTGSLLLVRRRGSVLWALPGGETRPATARDELLTTYCQRQIGVAPEAFGAVRDFSFAGMHFAAAAGVVVRGRVGARGRIEAIQWATVQHLPTDMDPAARVAAGLLARVNHAVVPGIAGGVHPTVSSVPA